MSENVVEYNAHAPGQSAPRITPAVQWLIAINVAVYFVQLAILKPGDVQLALGFQTKNLGHQWWTIGTYMFVHAGFWHLALNMYTLWLFGPRIEWKWGAREFTALLFVLRIGRLVRAPRVRARAILCCSVRRPRCSA